MLIFWLPVNPFLGLGILSAALSNLLLFDAGIWNFGVRLPSDEANTGAGISRSYLMVTLVASSIFQVWFAFGTEIYGRFFLLASHILLMGPWATHFLPIETAGRYFWAEAHRAKEGQFIEMVTQLGQEVVTPQWPVWLIEVVGFFLLSPPRLHRHESSQWRLCFPEDWLWLKALVLVLVFAKRKASDKEKHYQNMSEPFSITERNITRNIALLWGIAGTPPEHLSGRMWVGEWEMC